MITTSDSYAIETGSKTRFAGASIYCLPTVLEDSTEVRIELRILDSSSLVDSGILGGIVLTFANADLLAFTASGANEILKFYNLVEQTAKDYLEGLPQNSGATFTIV